MKVLFICKHNRFRSQIAEAFFRKFTKKHQVISAGIIQGSPINKEIKKAAKSFGLVIRSNPKGLTTKMLEWSDIAIIVADDVPKKIFSVPRRKKIILWRVHDVEDKKLHKIKKTISKIEGKVKKLAEEINYKKKPK